MLTWDSLEFKLLTLPDGSVYRKDFNFEVDGRTVTGWVGILAKGSRQDAGFSILQARRVIRVGPPAVAPTCRWNASPSNAPPRTTSSAAISTDASLSRR